MADKCKPAASFEPVHSEPVPQRPEQYGDWDWWNTKQEFLHSSQYRWEYTSYPLCFIPQFSDALSCVTVNMGNFIFQSEISIGCKHHAVNSQYLTSLAGCYLYSVIDMEQDVAPW